MLSINLNTAEILAHTVELAKHGLTEAAELFGMLRKAIVDEAVTADHEQVKRDTIKNIRDIEDNIRAAVEVLTRGTMPATEFREDLTAMMIGGWKAIHKDAPPAEIERFMLERANNIAQAYAGRVLRELK